MEDRRRFTARIYDDVTQIASATRLSAIVDNDRFTRKGKQQALPRRNPGRLWAEAAPAASVDRFLPPFCKAAARYLVLPQPCSGSAAWA